MDRCVTFTLTCEWVVKLESYHRDHGMMFSPGSKHIFERSAYRELVLDRFTFESGKGV